VTLTDNRSSECETHHDYHHHTIRLSVWLWCHWSTSRRRDDRNESLLTASASRTKYCPFPRVTWSAVMSSVSGYFGGPEECVASFLGPSRKLAVPLEVALWSSST